MSKIIDIPGRLHSTEQGNIVTGTNEIYDDTKGKKQNTINAETDALLSSLSGKSAELSQAIEAILALIPSAASALNKLADVAFVNSSVATASATFRGTYNLVTDLDLPVTATHQQIATDLASAVSTADNNDYAFVQIPVSESSTDIRVTERYKFDGTAWSYEYDLNNSGFTAAQWEAINSAITSALVAKLSALPTASELATQLAGKQNVLTFDNAPVSGSSNPVKSGGLYELFAAIDAKIPSDASANNKLVAENRLAAYVGGIIGALDGTFDLTSADGHVTVKLTQVDGKITNVEVVTSDIASAADLSTLSGDVAGLHVQVDALTGQKYVTVTATDQTTQAEDVLPATGQETDTIYRVGSWDGSQYDPNTYSEYAWTGTAYQFLHKMNYGVDTVPTPGSTKLVESGGVVTAISELVKSIPIVITTTYTTLLFKIVSGNVYKITTDASLIVITRNTPDGANIDRVEFNAAGTQYLTASADASYLYIYCPSHTANISISSMSTGENLLEDVTTKIFTGNYNSNTIDQKTTSGIYKNDAVGHVLYVRADSGVIYQNELLNDTAKSRFRVRSRKYDNGAWTAWATSYIGLNGEFAIVIHTGIMPNYNTTSKCVEFSSFTSIITSNGRWRVNDMAAFANDKLSVDVSSFTAFKILLNTNSNSLVAASITDISYDPSVYILVMCGRNDGTVFSIPVSVDGVSYESKVKELYDNSYGYSDDVNIVEPNNYDIIWTFWDYPQAIVTSKSKKLMFGFTDSVGRIGICTYDPVGKTFIRNILRKTNAVDDHNACIVTEDVDGKLIYLSDGKHGGENVMHNRVTKLVTTYEGDTTISQNVSALGRDKVIPIGGQCVYTQAFNVNGTWYVFTRKNATTWAYVSTTDFETWTSPKTIVFDPDNVQMYALFRPVTGETSLMRIVMYNNATTENTDISLGYIDLSTDKVYAADHTTELGTAGATGVSKNDFTKIVEQTSGVKIRLSDLAITDINNVVVSYLSMTDGYSVAQYKLYRNGTIIDTVTSTNPFLLSAFGGQFFVGDNPDKLVVNYFDDADATEVISGHDITKIMNYSNGGYIEGQVLNRHEVKIDEPYIREIRPRTDKDGKFVITQKGYYNSANYHDFLMDAVVYELDES